MIIKRPKYQNTGNEQQQTNNKLTGATKNNNEHTINYLEEAAHLHDLLHLALGPVRVLAKHHLGQLDEQLDHDEDGGFQQNWIVIFVNLTPSLPTMTKVSQLTRPSSLFNMVCEPLLFVMVFWSTLSGIF